MATCFGSAGTAGFEAGRSLLYREGDYGLVPESGCRQGGEFQPVQETGGFQTPTPEKALIYRICLRLPAQQGKRMPLKVRAA